ncbi:MAG: hypothetical protein V1846_02665 [Candidatus Komeilibacteria bacterium]
MAVRQVSVQKEVILTFRSDDADVLCELGRVFVDHPIGDVPLVGGGMVQVTVPGRQEAAAMELASGVGSHQPIEFELVDRE